MEGGRNDRAGRWDGDDATVAGLKCISVSLGLGAFGGKYEYERERVKEEKGKSDQPVKDSEEL